jgi:hypothetical protein
MKSINFNRVDFEPVRLIALQFAGATDSLSHYDTPSIKIGKNLLARLHESGEWFALRTDYESRSHFLEQYPESCFINAHFQNYPYVGMYLDNYTTELLKLVLESGYKAITTKKR